MGAELADSGADPSHRQPQLEEGLRLRPIPARGDPAFPLLHPYFEIVYAPHLGPSAVLLARAMARHLEAAGGPTTVDPVELALEIGIRASRTEALGKRSHLVRAIERLAHDHIAIRVADRVLGVPVAVPPLSGHALNKLPAPALVVHCAFVAPAPD